MVIALCTLHVLLTWHSGTRSMQDGRKKTGERERERERERRMSYYKIFADKRPPYFALNSTWLFFFVSLSWSVSVFSSIIFQLLRCVLTQTGHNGLQISCHLRRLKVLLQYVRLGNLMLDWVQLG